MFLLSNRISDIYFFVKLLLVLRISANRQHETILGLELVFVLLLTRISICTDSLLHYAFHESRTLLLLIGLGHQNGASSIGLDSHLILVLKLALAHSMVLRRRLVVRLDPLRVGYLLQLKFWGQKLPTANSPLLLLRMLLLMIMQLLLLELWILRRILVD